MINIIYLLSILLLPFTLSAQNYDMKSFDWEANPMLHNLSEEELKESYLVLKDKRVIEYIYEENNNLVILETKHQIVRVNDDRAIEEYNKVYIPLGDVIEIKSIKARTITHGNEIIEISPDNIKDMEMGDYGLYKIFALEGLSKGTEIEYFYTFKKQVTYYENELFQNEAIVKDASFELISPDNLIFIAKSYNHFPEFLDTIINAKRYLKASIDIIPPMQKEEYAVYNPNLMRIEYKFSHNTFGTNTEVLTWADGAKKFHEIIYTSDPKAEKSIQKILLLLKIDKVPVLTDKIKAIENYIKNNILIRNNVPEQLEEVSVILKEKYTNHKGMVKVFGQTLNMAGIKHQLVLTSDRINNVKFDPDFMSWNYLKYYLIYFPDINGFIAPTRPEYRFPLIPHEWSVNEGLFIKPIKVGDFTTALHEVSSIGISGYDKNFSNMSIDVDFSKGFQDLPLHVQYSFGGHLAMFIQPAYQYLSDEDKESAIKSILQSMGDDVKIKDKSIQNYELDISPAEKPFIIESNLTTNSLLEKAGDNYLFKIGNIIGRQVEMYQEKKRQNDVELEHPHSYDRLITFKIPDGYEVKDLDKLNLNISYGNDTSKTIGFISNYTLDGNQVKVKIDEFYKQTFYPKEQFEDFRKVINAAADFNKIVLVLEKREN